MRLDSAHDPAHPAQQEKKPAQWKNRASMREQMPNTAAFVDAMRDAFGAAEVNEQIRQGIEGRQGKFFAQENGGQVGTLFQQPVKPALVWDKTEGRFVEPRDV